jgi:hypothetical protein
MLNAVLAGSKLVVVVSGDSVSEFSESLRDLAGMFASRDRIFDDNRKRWYISNLEQYQHLPLVQNAQRAAEMQLPLF